MVTRTALADFVSVEAINKIGPDMQVCLDGVLPPLPGPLTICNLLVTFNDPADRLISVGNADLQVWNGPPMPGNEDVFWQHPFFPGASHPTCAELVDGICIPGFIPCFNDAVCAPFGGVCLGIDPTKVCDSFLTMGVKCHGCDFGPCCLGGPNDGAPCPSNLFCCDQNCIAEDDTDGICAGVDPFIVLSSDFSSTSFANAGHLVGGWFNNPPSNGLGDAGNFPGLQVLFFQSAAQVGLSLSGTLDIFWKSSDDPEVIVEEGVFVECRATEGEDCNANGMPDECDIDCGPPGGACDIPGCGQSEDCNENGVPDECDIADGTSDDNDGDGIPDECVLVLDMDIKPGSCPNPFNRHGNGVLPVALVGSGDFDPMQVDLSTLQLSRADGVGGSVGPNEGPPGPHSVFEDVATPFDGEGCECHDLGGDGIDDLSMKFRTRDLVDALELDDLSGGAVVELVLSGSLLDGTPFVAGDCIVIVPPGDLGPINATVGSNVGDTFIEVTPLDLNIDSDGFTNFGRSYYTGTVLTVTAPTTSAGRKFVRWVVDGVLQEIGVRTIEVAVAEDATLQALYQRQRRLRPDRPTESDEPLD